MTVFEDSIELLVSSELISLCIGMGGTLCFWKISSASAILADRLLRLLLLFFLRRLCRLSSDSLSCNAAAVKAVAAAPAAVESRARWDFDDFFGLSALRLDMEASWRELESE